MNPNQQMEGLESFTKVIEILVESVSAKDLPNKDPKDILVDLTLKFIGLVEMHGSQLKGAQKQRIVLGALLAVIDKFEDIFEESSTQKEFVHEVIPVLIQTSVKVANGFPLLGSSLQKLLCCTLNKK